MNRDKAFLPIKRKLNFGIDFEGQNHQKYNEFNRQNQ
jgi:hypothetical protein